MQTYYISLEREKILDAFEWQNDEENCENGVRELHIFPAQIKASERGLSADDPYPAKIHFIQSGNWYGPDVDESKISEFGLDFLFDEAINSDFQYLDWNYSAVRAEARIDFAEKYLSKKGLEGDAYLEALSALKDEIEERHLDEEYELYEAINAEEKLWVDNAAQWNRETASSALKSEMIDENLGICYKIVWID